MLIIYGCGGHARSVADVAISIGNIDICFIDENASANEKIFDFAIYKDKPIDTTDQAKMFIAIGDNQKRAALFESLKNFTTIVSNQAYVSQFASIAPGVFVGHGAYVGPNAKINENTIINTHCVIEHDCIVGKHSHISINATIAGKCNIGDFVMVGAAATVIDGIKVCSNVQIGAGAVVISDITEPGTYVGVPARKIKSLHIA